MVLLVLLDWLSCSWGVLDQSSWIFGSVGLMFGLDLKGFCPLGGSYGIMQPNDDMSPCGMQEQNPLSSWVRGAPGGASPASHCQHSRPGLPEDTGQIPCGFLACSAFPVPGRESCPEPPLGGLGGTRSFLHLRILLFWLWDSGVRPGDN